MDHVAIMQPSWGLLPKIISGQKTIESRWYAHRAVPWGKIYVGDSVYFKNSGEPVNIKAVVAKVLQFSSLKPEKVWELLARYGQLDGLELADLPQYYERFKDKKYCLLIFLESAEQIEPFAIDKSGFGLQAAWLTVPDIQSIMAV